MASKKKKLTKSKKDKIITGVIGGVADYLDIDTTLLRIIWLIVLALTGFLPGILVYFIAALIVPSK